MDIPLNADVKCADGTNGRSVCIIINPVHQEVTHLVVETKGLLGTKYMVPIELISDSTAHHIQLRCTLHDLNEMAPFIRAQFIGPEDDAYQDYYLALALDREGENGLYWPYAVHGDFGAYVGIEQIPHDELGIHRGAHVESTDGRIGRVDEFLINPENNHISHLVMRKGHLWGQKDVTIPVSDIKRIEEDVVYLKVDKQTVDKMNAIPVRRNLE
jgi:sporulation protein YlmC with PRC-barrel domain